MDTTAIDGANALLIYLSEHQVQPGHVPVISTANGSDHEIEVVDHLVTRDTYTQLMRTAAHLPDLLESQEAHSWQLTRVEDNLRQVASTIEQVANQTLIPVGMADRLKGLADQIQPPSITGAASKWWHLSASVGGSLLAGIGRLFGAARELSDLMSTYFTDGNHPWKQRRYELCLQEMVTALNATPQILRRIEDRDWTLADLIASLEQHTGSDAQREYALATIEALRTLTEQSLDHRSRYLRFMSLLRKALNHPQHLIELEPAKAGALAHPALFILLALAEVRFTQVHLFSFLSKLTQMMIHEGGASDPEVDDVACERQFKAIEAAPSEMKAPRSAVEWGKLKGTVNIQFDPARMSNTPYVNYDLQLGSGHMCRNVRFGTPTIQTGGGAEAEVNPEYHALLQLYEVMGRRHLYVNLQGLDPRWVGDESARSNAIHGLVAQYPAVLTVVSLSQGSAFYHQQGADFGVPALPRQAFIDHFISQLYDVDSVDTGFRIPDPYTGADYQKRSRSLLIKLMDAVAPGVPTLDRTQRQDLIELFYAIYTLDLLRLIEPASYIIACKDTIDRGVKNNAVLFRMVAILQERESDTQHLEEIQTLVHGPAITTKKQAMIPMRRERLLSALQRIADPQVCEALRTAFRPESFVGEQRPQIIKRAGQTLTPPELGETLLSEILIQLPDQDMTTLMQLQPGQKLAVDTPRPDRPSFYISAGNMLTTVGHAQQAAARKWNHTDRDAVGSHLEYVVSKIESVVEEAHRLSPTDDQQLTQEMIDGLISKLNDKLERVKAQIQVIKLAYPINQDQSAQLGYSAAASANFSDNQTFCSSLDDLTGRLERLQIAGDPDPLPE